MDSRVLDNFNNLVSSSARHPLLEYFEARLDAATKNLVLCRIDNFQQIQGRVLELQDIVKTLKTARTRE